MIVVRGELVGGVRAAGMVGEAKAEDAVAGIKFVGEPRIDEGVQGAIDGDAIESRGARVAGGDRVKDLLGVEGVVGGVEDGEHAQADGGDAELGGAEECAEMLVADGRAVWGLGVVVGVMPGHEGLLAGERGQG